MASHVLSKPSQRAMPSKAGMILRAYDAISFWRYRAWMLAWYFRFRLQKRRMLPRGPKRILIIRLASLGDMIKVGAILEALRQKYPSCRMEWLTSPAGQDLSAYMSGWDRVWGLGDLKALQQETFDWIVNLQRPDPPAGFLLPGHSYLEVLEQIERIPAGFRTGRRLVNGQQFHHTLIFYCHNELEELQLTALLPLGWELGNRTSLRAPASALVARKPGNSSRPLVALFLGAASAKDHDGGKRSYSIPYLMQLAFELSGKYDVWLFGQSQAKSEEEKAVLADFLKANPDIHSVIDQTDLGSLLGFLNAVDAVITCDSGPLHMAMALKKPLVALYSNAADFRLGGPRIQALTRRINAQEPCFRVNYRWKFFCQACEEKHSTAYQCRQKEEPKPLDQIPTEAVIRHLSEMLPSGA